MCRRRRGDCVEVVGMCDCGVSKAIETASHMKKCPRSAALADSCDSALVAASVSVS